MLILLLNDRQQLYPELVYVQLNVQPGERAYNGHNANEYIDLIII